MNGHILKKETEMAENKQLIPMAFPGNYYLETIHAAYDVITNGKTKGKVLVSIQ